MEPSAFRKALGSFATGVTIITTTGPDGGDIGVTANSFNSVSLDPPMVLWSLARNSGSLAAFEAAGHFAVHILAADQEGLSNRFASRGIDKFEGVTVERGAGEVPLLTGCNARFQCRSVYRYEGGDHVIFVGEVVAFDHRAAPPLLFHGGRYANAAAVPDQPANGDRATLSHALQRAYFQLLQPVRRERVRAGVGLEDHYVLEVLMAGPKSVEEIDGLISYTGLHVTSEIAGRLIARGLVEERSGEGSDVLALTEAGRRAVIGLSGAAQAAEAEAALHLSTVELAQLMATLRRLGDAFESDADTPVSLHFNLLDRHRKAPAELP